MAEPAQPLDINTLRNVYAVKELIQLIVKSDAKIIDNSHWTEDFTSDFFLEYLSAAANSLLLKLFLIHRAVPIFLLHLLCHMLYHFLLPTTVWKCSI